MFLEVLLAVWNFALPFGISELDGRACRSPCLITVVLTVIEASVNEINLRAQGGMETFVGRCPSGEKCFADIKHIYGLFCVHLVLKLCLPPLNQD